MAIIERVKTFRRKICSLGGDIVSSQDEQSWQQIEDRGMKQSPKISVVVPVYKAERFLHGCVDSILAQTFEDFELLLIDDGSPDSSGKICDEYAENDHRVRVFHTPNGGANKARALGVSESAGSEYITFVDSDDSLPSTALHDLYALAGEEYDIIIGNYDRNPKQYADGEMDNLELVKRIYAYSIASSPYAKLFRRELFDEETFDLPRDFVMGEDFIMNLRLAFACDRKIRIAHTVVYHYNDNTEGIMNTFNYTLDYLGSSYHFKKSVIPEPYRERCMPYCIANVLMMNHVIVGHYYYHKTREKTQLHLQVIEDIRNYGYKGQWWERFALRFANPMFSRLYLGIRAMTQWLKRMKRRWI